MFSALTSKIFGGGLLALLIFTVINEINHRKEMNAARQEINEAVAQRNVERGNAIELRGALRQCNDSVIAAAEVAERVGAVGVQAVRSVRQAGARSVETVVARVNAAPAATCEDAEAILRGEAG